MHKIEDLKNSSVSVIGMILDYQVQSAKLVRDALDQQDYTAVATHAAILGAMAKLSIAISVNLADETLTVGDTDDYKKFVGSMMDWVASEAATMGADSGDAAVVKAVGNWAMTQLAESGK